MSVLILIYIILFAFLSYRHSEWAVYLIILFFPAYLLRFYFLIPWTVLEVSILVLFFIWAFKKVKFSHSKGISSVTDLYFNLEMKTKDVLLPMFLFLFTATISMFVSSDLRSAAGIWKAYFIEPFLFFMVFIDVIDTKEKLRNTLFAAVLSIALPGIFALYQKITGNFIFNPFWQKEETRRVVSVYGYPNAIALYFVPVISVGFILLSTFWKKWSRFIPVLAIIIIGILSVVFARSKGGFLALIAGLIVFIIVYRWSFIKRHIYKAVIVLAIIVISVGVLGYSMGVFDTFKTVAGGGSWEVRWLIWSETVQMLKDRLLLGAGLSGFQTALTPYHTKEYIEIFLYPHNIFLNFWSETGLAGLVSFVWIVFVLVKKLLSFIDRERVYVAGFLAYFTVILVHGMVDVPYFKNDLSVFFWYIAACIVVLDYLQYKYV